MLWHTEKVRDSLTTFVLMFFVWNPLRNICVNSSIKASIRPKIVFKHKLFASSSMIDALASAMPFWIDFIGIKMGVLRSWVCILLIALIGTATLIRGYDLIALVLSNALFIHCSVHGWMRLDTIRHRNGWGGRMSLVKLWSCLNTSLSN